MHGWRLAILVLLAACPGPRAPSSTASCPEAARLLDEAAAARTDGYLFRALVRAEAADRACASEATRRAVADLRAELWGPGEPPAAAAPATAATAAAVRAAALLRLAGQPDHAVAKLRPIAAQLDPTGRAELSRALAASRRPAEARAALEQAAARAERRHGGRGRWRWLPGDFERFFQLAFTPDGTRLIARDNTGWIRIWDVAGGHETVRIRPRNGTGRLAVSPDGAWIAAAAPATSATSVTPTEVWDAATGKLAFELPESGPASGLAAFTPEGHLVVSSPEGLRVVELPSGKQLDKLELGDPHRLVIARDRIYAADEDAGRRQPVVTVWERGGAHRKLHEIALPGHPWHLDVTPRGEIVVLLPDRILIHGPQGKLRRTIEGAYAALAITPDGKRLAASTPDGGVEVLDVGSGQRIRRADVGPDLSAVAIHPRGSLLATAGADGVSLWSVADAERTARFGPPSAARSIAFDADGRRLAVGSASGTATIWDLTTGGQIAVTPRAGAAVTSVAFGPGGILATASEPPPPPPPPPRRGPQPPAPTPPGVLAVWDTRGAQRWSKELDQLSWLDFRPGTGALATVSSIQSPPGRGLTLWDAQGAGQPALELSSYAGFAWTPDGARLAYAEDSTSFVLAPVDGSPATTLQVQADRAAFQPGGGLLALAGYDGRLSLWDAATRQLRRVIRDPAGDAVAIAWTPGGGAIASAAGATVRLWDPRTGARLATLEAHAAVTAFAFRPDGRLLAAACDDGRIELWSVADAALVAMLATPGSGRGIVLAPDGAVDGALADDDPLFWEVGATTLHARAVWDREVSPGLLAARLAKVPAEAAPRPGLAGAAPDPAPPACLAAPDPAGPVSLQSASAPDDRSLSLCVAPRSRPPAPRPLPTCFVLDLASGAFRPRAPTPHEALGEPEPEPTTAELDDDARLEVCHAGACRTLAIPELAADDGPLHATALAASDDGRLAAAILQRGGTSRDGVGHAIIHDVATGRRIGRAELGGAYARLRFLGDTLLVTHQLCAEPCLPSWLVDPRTGKRRAAVGGAQPLLASQITAARVAGDLWAFHGRGAPALVFQDVKTGRVAARVDRPAPCQSDQAPHACDLRLLHAGGGLALLEEYRDASRVTVLDVRGAIVAQHQVPRCKP